MSKEKQVLESKQFGLVLLVEEDDKIKTVFYKAYYTLAELENALNTDETLKEVMTELKPIKVQIISILNTTKRETENEGKENGDDN